MERGKDVQWECDLPRFVVIFYFPLCPFWSNGVLLMICCCLLLASLRNAKNELAFTCAHSVLCFPLIASSEVNVEGYRIVIFFDLFCCSGVVRSPFAIRAESRHNVCRHRQASSGRLNQHHLLWPGPPFNWPLSTRIGWSSIRTVATQTALHSLAFIAIIDTLMMKMPDALRPEDEHRHHFFQCLPRAASQPIDREKAKWTVHSITVKLSWAARN